MNRVRDGAACRDVSLVCVPSREDEREEHNHPRTEWWVFKWPVKCKQPLNAYLNEAYLSDACPTDAYLSHCKEARESVLLVVASSQFTVTLKLLISIF